jgi:serine/threonine-protein kinase
MHPRLLFMPDALPSYIGRFQVRAELGRGGFGKVFCAFDPTVGRLVAIKVLTDASKDVLSRFRNEAFVAGNLRHENIVTVYEYGEFKGDPFLVMEYLEGEDLHQIIASHKPLSLLQKCNTMSQVAEGLYSAHRHGVVHRDIKPANIMVLRDGRVKIMDFGIARLAGDRNVTRLTQEGFVIGTLLYMAPEQLSGGEVDALCDIFAFGVLFYELLTGRHPFQASDARALMYKTSFEDPPPLRDFVPECPEALQRAISRLLHKDRQLRYQSLKELQLDIEPVCMELQQQQAATLLKQAQELYARKQLESVQPLVLEVLDLDPSNRLARSLWEDLQKQLQLRTLQPRIEALVKSGEGHLAQRRFSDAVQSFDSALKLDRDNTDIQSRRAETQAMLDRSKQATVLLGDARLEFDRQNLTSAHRIVTEALRQDPQHPEAGEVLKVVERALEYRQRERRVEEALARADTLLVMNDYDQAAAVLSALGATPEFPKVQNLLALIEVEKGRYGKRQRLQAEIAVATDLVRQQRYQEAVDSLDKLAAEFPESQEVAHHRAYARKELDAEVRSRALAEIADQVNALENAYDFDRALAVLDQALKTYPGEGILIRLLGGTLSAKADWNRQRAISATLAQCKQLQSRGKFAEAIQAVELAAREYGSQPELVETLQRLESEWEQQRRAEAIREATDRATALLGEERAEDAVQLIRQTLRECPGEPSLTDLLARAQERAAALQHARAVDAILREAAAHATARAFERAFEVLARGLKAWPEDEAILRRQAALHSEKRAWERAQAVQDAVQHARQLGSQGEFTEALRQIDSALQTLSGEPALLDLRQQLERELRERQKREAVQHTAAEARRLLDADGPDQVVKLLHPIMQAYPGEPELETLASEAQARIREREIAAAIASLIEKARGLRAARQFDGALQILDQAVPTFPGEPALQRELQAIRTAKAAWDQEQAIAGILRHAGQLSQALQYPEALQTVAQGLRQYPGEPELLKVQRQLESEWEEHQRREAIKKAESGAGSLIDGGRFDQAVEFLRAALAQYPGEGGLERLLVRAEEELRRKVRADAIAKTQAEAEALVRQHRFGEAADLLEGALQIWPDEATILRLQEFVRERQAAREYQQAIDEAVRQSENLVRQGRFEDALRLLQQALGEYPDDQTLQVTAERIGAEWEQQNRVEAVGKAASQARLLLEQGRFDEALALMQEASHRYPGEPLLETLAARAGQELRARQQRAAAAQQGEALIGQGRFDEAIRALQEAVARFPDDEALSGMLTRAREFLELRRRTEAIDKLANDVRKLSNNHNFEGALMLLDRGLRNWPGEKSLLDLQDSVCSSEAAWRRDLGRQETIRAIGNLVRGNRYSEALPLVDAALRDYPGEPSLVALREQIRKGKALQDANRLFGQGKPDMALRLLEELAPDYPDDPELRGLAERCREQMRVLERAAAIAELGRKARDLADAKDYEGASSLLKDGLSKWPGNPDLSGLLQTIAAEKTTWERCQAVGEELRAFTRSVADTPATISKAAAMLERARTLGAECPDNQELRSVATATIEHLSDVVAAARELEGRQYRRALEIARPYLVENPEHATFARLATTAEQGQEAADLEELKLAVAREPNLDAQARMWRQAQEQFPDEPWIEDELQQVRDKLNLAVSIAGKARALESESRVEAALEQWKRLLEVHPHYAGLDAAIARLEQAIRQARADAVARWLTQIDQQIESGDWANAGETVRRAKAEFPKEPALEDAARRLNTLREARARAREMLAQGKAACEQRDFEAGRTRLHQAFELDKRDSDLRTEVLSYLTKYSRTALFQGDLQQAETLVREAISLDPGYQAPVDLTQAIADAKRADLVQACLTRAAQLRDAGDLRAALGEVEQLLGTYPKESQLKKTREKLLAAIREIRERLLSELHGMRAAAENSSDRVQLEELRQRAAALAVENQHDSEVRAGAEDLVRSLATRINQIRRARLLAPLTKPRNWIAGLLAGTLVIAGVLVVPRMILSRRQVTIRLTSDIAGASVEAGGKSCQTPCSFSLAPGQYDLKAVKDGYEPVAQPLVISSGGSEMVLPLSLKPLPEMLLVNSNFESGAVFLDGRRAGELNDGQFSLNGIAAGRHTIRVTGGGTEFEAQWQSAPGTLPKVDPGFKPRDVQALLVGNIGQAGNIACNCDIQNVAVDGVPGGSATVPAGQIAPLPRMAAGTHQITMNGRSLVIDVHPNPTLTVFLSLDRNVGTLVVDTGQDNARVYLNNRLYQRPTERGLVRIPVTVGSYSIRVEKEGYRSAPPETVEIRKGEEKRVTMALTQVPPVLEIAGALPGAQVKLDGKPIGETDAKGVIRKETEPGDHVVQLTKEGYTPVRFSTRFNPGTTVRPDRGQLAMSRIVKPPDPAQLEAQEWQRISATDSIDQLEDFIRRHPGGAHAEEARAREGQLRQQQQANTARAAEQAAWNNTDKSKKAALQDFLSRYGSGSHASEARGLIAAIEKQEAADALAVQRSKELEEKEKKEQLNRKAGDEQSITQILSEFEAAYNRKDLVGLETIWNPMPGNTASIIGEQFRIARTITFQLRPLASPVVSGDSASVDCTRTLNLVARDGQKPPAVSERVRVSLGRTRSGWAIKEINRF